MLLNQSAMNEENEALIQKQGRYIMFCCFLHALLVNKLLKTPLFCLYFKFSSELNYCVCSQ